MFVCLSIMWYSCKHTPKGRLLLQIKLAACIKSMPLVPGSGILNQALGILSNYSRILITRFYDKNDDFEQTNTLLYFKENKNLFSLDYVLSHFIQTCTLDIFLPGNWFSEIYASFLQTIWLLLPSPFKGKTSCAERCPNCD